MNNKGLYIVFEGPDGSGKSMQAQKIVARLNQLGMQTVHFREPGGEIGKKDTIGLKIRALLLDNRNKINPMCELALFTANRAQLIEEIKEYTEKGINVLCERNFLSSVVYQGYGRGMDIDFILETTRSFVDKSPDLVILFQVGTDEGTKRVTDRGEMDRFENEPAVFQQRVIEGYSRLKEICDGLGIRCIEIDTNDKCWDKYEERAMQEILNIRI